MIKEIRDFSITLLPMVSRDGLQRTELKYDCSRVVHLFLEIRDKETGEEILQGYKAALNCGKDTTVLMLPAPERSFQSLWRFTDRQGQVVLEREVFWEKPRERTIYVMISSHTDIGLHNSQYIQRYNSSRFIDMAGKLCDETQERDECDRYRYVMEGTWFFNNYGMDRGREAALEICDKYIGTGKMGVCCGVAGNHTQVYGLEEMCRSTYEKKRLKENWDVESETMSMVDNNGMSMAMIQPYAEAGIRNIIFAPNQWNPLPSTVWKCDYLQSGYTWTPNAGGGGARIDVRYDSELPMVFFWEDGSGHRLLVWASNQYSRGGAPFGFCADRNDFRYTVETMEEHMAGHLPLMEEKYPYDLWLVASYSDDQEPSPEQTDMFRDWNAKWMWPRIRTLGNPDEPFHLLREKYEDRIPVLKGDITGGWYQHPVTTPELLAQKFETDRLLPTAEKWSVTAGVLNENYEYPAEEFRRAWDGLLFNDEHSYGTSGYQGRRVYETWMQHRDWIDKAQETAQKEIGKALKVISEKIASDSKKVVVFNPTALDRCEYILSDDAKKYSLAHVPSFGYRTVSERDFHPVDSQVEETDRPPVIENAYYRIVFTQNGSFGSIVDKELNRELLSQGCEFHGNELVYTKDNHSTFLVPDKAAFQVIREREKTTVVVRTRESHLGTEIVQYISLPDYEKRIDIDNRLYHVKDMVNNSRYFRFLYFAFPFAVDNCRRYCHLNGTAAEYAKDVTGHGTDVYMAVNEWCCAENSDYGVALLMLDSQLVEFDHIHPDKTDFGDTGDGSGMFVYSANDWLQMHTPGGSHLDYRFRYSIVSYRDNYKKAGIPQKAELFANPLQTVMIGEQKGILDSESHSFLKVGTGQRLVCLKRADDGDGIIARLYGEGENAAFEDGYGRQLTAKRVRIDESPMSENRDTEEQNDADFKGFSTYRLGQGRITLKERTVGNIRGQNGAPAPVGSVYTGLITQPKAAAGENPGQLYLLWGQNMEGDFSHYKLYRSEEAEFEADETTFVADVMPEEYRVGRFVDCGLKEHTCYYYRVCAVNAGGQCSEMSDVFYGITKESL